MNRLVLSLFCVVVLVDPAVASEGESPGFFYPILNLLLLVAVLFYFGRKPILEFFSQRRVQIEEDIEKAEGLRSEAEERYATWQRKLADLDEELEGIRSRSRERAESERAQILRDANATSERIRADATAAIEQELRRARAVLHEEAADLAVELAENMLRQQVTESDRERLVREFIERIEHTGAESGR
jgi:F-type H+-transporting ATPase subunit b